MALSSLIIWEIRGGAGADTNGGGFKSGASGTDWSQQNSAQYSVTDGVTNGTTTITSATANFGTDVVGNLIYVQGGTGSITAGWYEITARTNSTTITVDRSTGLTSGTGVTLKIGGALNTIQKAVDNMVSGNWVYVKNATYTELVTLKTNGTTGRCNRLIGYNSTRSDTPEGTNRPLITGSSSRARCLDWKSVSDWSVEYFRFTAATGSGVDSSDGVVGQASGRMIGCKSYSNGAAGFSIDTYMKFLGCEAGSNGSDYGFGQGHYTRQYMYCYSHDNTGDGFQDDTIGNHGGLFAFCVSDTNTGNGIYAHAHTSVFNCTGYNNSSHQYQIGIGSDSTAMGVVYNNIAQSGGAYGFYRLSSNYGFPFFDFNQYNSNSSGGLNNLTGGSHDVTSNASMTDPANADFTLGGSSPALNVGLAVATFTDANA